MHKWLILAATAALLAIGFQNCSSDMGPNKEAANSSAGSPNPAPAPGPAPGPGTPAPAPTPTPGGQVQPNANNAINDVKPRVSGNCPAGYGLYDLLNTTPAIQVGSIPWEHQTCVKPFAMGNTSVISDAQLVVGTSCPAGTELLQTATIPANAADYSTARWNMAHVICIKRANVPVSSSFVTYFYYSAPNANCRAGDVANGSATYCPNPNPNGACNGGVNVNFCRALQ